MIGKTVLPNENEIQGRIKKREAELYWKPSNIWRRVTRRQGASRVELKEIAELQVRVKVQLAARGLPIPESLKSTLEATYLAREKKG